MKVSVGVFHRVRARMMKYPILVFMTRARMLKMIYNRGGSLTK
jgi:hypothetical protein